MSTVAASPSRGFKIRLQAYRVFRDRCVPIKGDSILPVLNWVEFKEKLGITSRERPYLRGLARDLFVGRYRRGNADHIFLLKPDNPKAPDIKFLLQKDPLFASKMIKMYRVLDVESGIEMPALQRKGLNNQDSIKVSALISAYQSRLDHAP